MTFRTRSCFSPFFLAVAVSSCGVSDRMVDVDPGTGGGDAAADARRDAMAGAGGAASGGDAGGAGGGAAGSAAGSGGSAAGGGGSAAGSGGSAAGSGGSAAGSGGSAAGSGGSATGGAAGTGGGGTGGNATGGLPGDGAAPDARPDVVAVPDGGTQDGCLVNACGGCGVLAGMPNAVCGSGCGTYVCSADKSSVTCSDPAAGGCCIGAMVYASGTVKSDNTCMGCAPAQSTTAWSARTTCGNGNAGCTCSAGTPKETNCSDGVTNDGDGPIDCADTDCNALVCLSQTNDARAPNDDYWVRYDEQGNAFQQNGSMILELYRGGSAGPHAYQWSYVWLMFGTLPQSSSATISKAVLRFHYTSTSANFANTTTPTTVSIKDARAIGNADPKLCTITLPVVPTTPSAITCDVTATVQDWFANAVPVGQRGFRIASDTAGDQSVNIAATEGSSTTAPRLLLDYTTKCAGNVCPNL